MNNGGPHDRQLASGDELAFGPNDVLNGRTKLSFNHIGNRRFREVVGQSIDDYNSANSRAEKYGIVETIVEEIAKSGGRFLKADDAGNWVELEPEVVRQKIAHAIRDTTKKKEAKKAKATNSQKDRDRILKPAAVSKAPPNPAPPNPSSARTARPESNSNISSLVQGLNDYRRNEMMMRGTLPTVDEDDDVKMAPVSVASTIIPQKRPLGEGMIPGMMRPAMKVAKPEPWGPLGTINARKPEPWGLGPIGAKSQPRHSLGPCTGLGQHDSTRMESRYELRQENEHAAGLWEPRPLPPDLPGISSGIQEPNIEDEPRPAGVPTGRRHTMPASGASIGNKGAIAASYGVNQVSYDELPHTSSEECQAEDPSLSHDDDFLSKINQLPGLSDADPHFP